MLCEPEKAQAIAEKIELVFHAACIRPKLAQRFWRKGRHEIRLHEFMPEYVFAYSKKPIDNFYTARSILGVTRIIGSFEVGYELFGEDFEFANMLFQEQGVFGVIKVHEDENRRIRLLESLYGNFNCEIEKVERRRGRARISFDFDKHRQVTWVAYEVAESEFGLSNHHQCYIEKSK